MLNCNRLRTLVILSGSIFLVGLILQLLAEVTAFAVPTSHLALFAILAGVGLMAGTFLVSLLPGSARRLDNCQH